MEKKLQSLAWVLIVILGLYILYRGFSIARESRILSRFPGLERAVESMAADIYMPGLSYSESGAGGRGNWLDTALEEIFPLYSYAGEAVDELPDIESRLEYELMVAEEAQRGLREGTAMGDEAEDAGGEDRGRAGENAGGDGETKSAEKGGQAGADRQGTETDVREDETGDEPEKGKEGDAKGNAGQADIQAKDPSRTPVLALNEDDLRDYNYLLNNFFAVDPSTTPLESQLNYDLLMGKDLALTGDNSKPQILIYHTHSQEAFIDSRPGEVSDTIVGVGDRLTSILQDTYGFNVIHHTKVYDLVDGVLDRSMAYTLAAPDIQSILDQNPSIEVVIDLHRDGVDGHKFVKEIDGKPTAQIMFFNGLSRSAMNGEIGYLPNPYIQDNLAFSFQLQKKAAEYYPGWTRNIYLNSLRYNLHMRPKSLLIESGTQLNTVEEEYNAMELLADILNQVLRGG